MPDDLFFYTTPHIYNILWGCPSLRSGRAIRYKYMPSGSALNYVSGSAFRHVLSTTIPHPRSPTALCVLHLSNISKLKAQQP